MTLIHLSFPPSANSIWRAVNGKVLMSAPYRKWKANALKELMVQHPARVLGPYRMTLVATRPDRRARDLGNLEKACSDLLVTAGVITDDSLAQSIKLEWRAVDPEKPGGVHITLEAA